MASGRWQVVRPLVFCLVTCHLPLVTTKVSALPSFQQFFDDKAGYAASCLVCHEPNRRGLTPYAREYLRLGRGAAALESLDLMDPDRDEVASKTEIRLKSNPGDARSTPDHPGDWLAAAGAPPPAPQELTHIFGSDFICDVVEKKFSSTRFQEIEYALREKLNDEDRFQTVFAVETVPPDVASASGTAAVPEKFTAAYAFSDPPGLSIFLVAMSSASVLKAVAPIQLEGDQRLKGRDYLKQFEGKTDRMLSVVASPRGAEAENARVIKAVRRCMKLMEAISGE